MPVNLSGIFSDIIKFSFMHLVSEIYFSGKSNTLLFVETIMVQKCHGRVYFVNTACFFSSRVTLNLSVQFLSHYFLCYVDYVDCFLY